MNLKAPCWICETAAAVVEDGGVLCRGSEKLGMRSALRCLLNVPLAKLDVDPEIVPNLRVIIWA